MKHVTQSVLLPSVCYCNIWTITRILSGVVSHLGKTLHNPVSLLSSALWFHNTLALQFGVGVNVFWRHLPADRYDKKDPYGNKDPVAATRALQALERALHTLDELPADYRDFYGRRMIQRIQKRTQCDSPSSTITQEDSWQYITQQPIHQTWRNVE